LSDELKAIAEARFDVEIQRAVEDKDSTSRWKFLVNFGKQVLNVFIPPLKFPLM